MAYTSDSDHETSAGAGRTAPDSWALATERARLAAVQAAAQTPHQQPDGDRTAGSASASGDSSGSQDQLRRLADLDPELRTQLHIIMGNIQLLRLEQTLDPQLERRLDAMLSAGGQLLGKIHDAQQPSDKQADASPLEVTAHTRVADADKALPGLDVLVADDIEMNRDIAAALLRGAGHRVSLADDGGAALLMATKTDFDVILMDLRMPGMDGMEATRRIRNLPGSRGQVPIVALTAKASGDEVAACRAAGMNGHLAKPFRHDTLIDAVERVATARPAKSATAAVMATPDGPPSAFSTSQLRALIAPPPGRAANAGANAPGEDWVDILSPWSMASDPQLPGVSAPLGGQTGSGNFVMTFKRDRAGDLCSLTDTRRSCAPPVNRDQHEYHWLMFVEPGSAYPDKFTTECELWRWNRGAWRSIAVPGASFSPDDMYRDGWRYCRPCDNPIAHVEIVETKPEPGFPKFD